MSTKPDENDLKEAFKKDPADWEARKRYAHLLYDQGRFQDAADVVWAADEIPSIDLELAFAARVLAKAAPRKSIRLLTALLEHNRGKAVQNLGLANALLHHGMVLQAARFYGAAMEADPSLGNPDLEHFILWTDDEETLWGNFNNRRPKLGVLPWMKRDPQEAMKLTSSISTHTTPIKVASLEEAPGEELANDLYEQTPEKGADPSPPPAVTIPLDRVEEKHRRFDPELGAPSEQPEPPKKRARSVAKKAAGTKPVEKAAAVPKPSAAQPYLPAAPASPAARPRKPDLPALATPTVEAAMPVPPPSLSGGSKPVPARPAAASTPDLPGLKKLKLTPSHPAKLKMPSNIKLDEKS